MAEPNSAVERVAQALYALAVKDGLPWSSEKLRDERELYRQQARAAIVEMRKPTGARLLVEYPTSPEAVDEMWSEMIDAALAGEGVA